MGRRKIKKGMIKRLQTASYTTSKGMQASAPQSSIVLNDLYFTGPLSKHIAARKIKHGVSKGSEIARLNKELKITNPI